MKLRKKRGELLATFYESNCIWHMNSHFGKPSHKRWIYNSTGKHHKHEINHNDVSVLPSITNGSEHRLLRGNLHFNSKIARFEQVKRRKPGKRVLDPDFVLEISTTSTVLSKSNLLHAAIVFAIDLRHENVKLRPLFVRDHANTVIFEETQRER
uniref:Uncharacterized protein n=1 Tax=Caenorhabditis japonica TaxID=281687 RepID=A0A8R1E8K1_CAEJA